MGGGRHNRLIAAGTPTTSTHTPDNQSTHNNNSNKRQGRCLPFPMSAGDDGRRSPTPNVNAPTREAHRNKRIAANTPATSTHTVNNQSIHNKKNNYRYRRLPFPTSAGDDGRRSPTPNVNTPARRARAFTAAELNRLVASGSPATPTAT